MCENTAGLLHQDGGLTQAPPTGPKGRCRRRHLCGLWVLGSISPHPDGCCLRLKSAGSSLTLSTTALLPLVARPAAPARLPKEPAVEVGVASTRTRLHHPLSLPPPAFSTGGAHLGAASGDSLKRRHAHPAAHRTGRSLYELDAGELESRRESRRSWGAAGIRRQGRDWTARCTGWCRFGWVRSLQEVARGSALISLS